MVRLTSPPVAGSALAKYMRATAVSRLIAHIGLSAVQFVKRIAPDIGKIDRPRNRAVRLFGKLHVADRTFHVALEEDRVTGIGQYLVDTPSRHDIATEKQGNCARGLWMLAAGVLFTIM